MLTFVESTLAAADGYMWVYDAHHAGLLPLEPLVLVCTCKRTCPKGPLMLMMLAYSGAVLLCACKRLKEHAPKDHQCSSCSPGIGLSCSTVRHGLGHVCTENVVRGWGGVIRSNTLLFAAYSRAAFQVFRVCRGSILDPYVALSP